MASQSSKSWDSCHRNVTGCLATCWMVQNASWSQLEPGKMMTPNFIVFLNQSLAREKKVARVRITNGIAYRGGFQNISLGGGGTGNPGEKPGGGGSGGTAPGGSACRKKMRSPNPPASPRRDFS